MIDCLEQTLHVASCTLLRESLISLLGNLVEKGHTGNILHDKVDVFLVVVSLIVLDNIGVVKRVENCDFLHYAIDVVSQFDFVQNFNCHFKIFVVLVFCQKDAAESANTQHLRLRVDVIVLF